MPVLRQVAEQSRQVAAGLDGAAAIPVSVVHKPPVTSPESIRALLLEANASERVRRPDRLDAHLLSREDVDRRSPRAPEAAPPPPHAVQPRAPVGRGRHGLHEPEPVGARGSGVRLPRDAHAPPTEDRRGALDGADASSSGSAPGRERPAAGTRRSRCESPASATTCARSRARTATRSRRRSASASRSTATASASSSRRSATWTTRASTSWSRSTKTRTSSLPR